jgi:hypothetical protein
VTSIDIIQLQCSQANGQCGQTVEWSELRAVDLETCTAGVAVLHEDLNRSWTIDPGVMTTRSNDVVLGEWMRSHTFNRCIAYVQ